METGIQSDAPLVRIMGLHALRYCERLYYLEEIEEIRRADDRVLAGRRLHEERVSEGIETLTYELESEVWRIRGKADAVRYRDGALVPYEHKKGRSNRREAWPTDRLQVIAYCAMIAEATGKAISEGRIRYHADNVTVRIPFDEAAKNELREAVARAETLRATTERPPVTPDERLCRRCSLAPVCLPEEERLAAAMEETLSADAPEMEVPIESPPRKSPRLFPENEDRRVVHVTEPGSRVERAAERLVVEMPERAAVEFPGRDVAAVVLHGNVQITTQALQYCAARDIGIHWLSGGGAYIGSLAGGSAAVQRRHRQYAAMQDDAFRLDLARRVVAAKVGNQLRYLLRATRPSSNGEGGERDDTVSESITRMRQALARVGRAADMDELRGHEGLAGVAYFAALPKLVHVPEFAFDGRNRRPPRDRFNALLSFFYALLYKDCVAALVAVGLEPAFGVMHAPRSAAQPLALDLMELIRVLLGDMVVVASVNRRQWDPDADFLVTPHKVWLSLDGKRKAIALAEQRKQETWKHPVLDYSLSYQRTIELEARLLEKEWTGAGGLFAKSRLR